MKKMKRKLFIGMIIMAVISFSNLLGLKIAGVSVLVGVVFFFINKALEKQAFRGSGLDIKAIGINMRDRKIWFWVTLPLIMDALSITIADLFFPEFIDHVLARTEILLSFDNVIFLMLQLAVLALGEEIAWRAFFQKQLSESFPFVPALLITSILFAFGHLSEGNIIMVIYDILFIFINSIFYGIIFQKSNNAWISAISHFSANLFSVIVLVFLK